MVPEEWIGIFVVCIFYYFWTWSILFTVLMSIGYGRVKHKAVYPSSPSGNRDVLLLFESSEIARDWLTQRPGNKDSLSPQRLFFAEIPVYVPLLTENSVPCRAQQCTTAWKPRCSSSGLGLLHAMLEYATEKQVLHRWSFHHLCRICLMVVQNRVFHSNYWSLLERQKVCWDCFNQLLFVSANNKRELLGAVFSAGSDDPTFSFPLSSICQLVTEHIEKCPLLSHASVLKSVCKSVPRNLFNLLLTPWRQCNLLLNYS